MNDKLKDILIRAGKTFIQGFLAVIVTYAITTENIFDKNFWLAVLVAGLAGGLSALMNSIKLYLESIKK